MCKLDSSDPRSAPLAAGVQAIISEMVDSGARTIMRAMAEARGGRRVVFRDGLHGLRELLPEYEGRLIALHLDFGISDSAGIAACIGESYRRNLGSLARSIAATFRGADRAGANRDVLMFDAEVGMYTSGLPGRVLVAVERHRRKNPVTVKVMARSPELC